MKYTKAAILLFFSVLAQVSFLRLIEFLPFTPNLPFIILFILSYRLPRFGILVLAAFAGALVDLFSAAPFGLSVFSAMAAFFVYYAVREKFSKGKNFENIFFFSAMFFICFYSFFFVGNWLLNFFGESSTVFNLFDKIIALEIISSAIIAATIVYFLESKLNYVNIRDYKRFFKISA